MIILRKLFEPLRQYNLSLNPSKSQFGYKKVKVLGFIVESGKVSMDPNRIKAIQNIGDPTSLEEEEKFMDFSSF